MASERQGQIVETPIAARRAGAAAAVALLTASTGLAALILGVAWFVVFRV